MKSRIKTTVLTLGVGALLGLMPAALPASELSSAAKPAALETLAKEAKTSGEHLEVARQYELRGKGLQAKAESMEREIRQRKANPSAMETKWPAMVVNARERREQVAMQTRRAAEESFRLAEHHRTLARDSRAALR